MSALTHRMVIEDGSTKRDHQLELEKLYDKNQLMPRVRKAFRECAGLDFSKLMVEAGIDLNFGFDLLAQIAVHKRATVPTIVGALRHHCASAQAAATELEKCVNAKLLSYFARDQQLVVEYEITSSLQSELDRYQFPLPMVVRPRELKHNLDSGYLLGKSSVILRDNHTDEDVCLDHLNRLNQMKLTINLGVAKTIQNKWKGLDKKHEDESWDDFMKRKKAFAKYDSVAKDVMEKLLKEGNEIYLCWKYDKRGRCYPTGFHVNPQGTPWNKAVVEFADRELVID